jgi:hypothetical protein
MTVALADVAAAAFNCLVGRVLVNDDVIGLATVAGPNGGGGIRLLHNVCTVLANADVLRPPHTSFTAHKQLCNDATLITITMTGVREQDDKYTRRQHAVVILKQPCFIRLLATNTRISEHSDGQLQITVGGGRRRTRHVTCTIE